jgi:hypothetical protein
MSRDDTAAKWKLVTPEATVSFGDERVNAHPDRLSGKTVLLYWNGKPNGDVFLNRLAELLMTEIGDVTIVKAWEASTVTGEGDPTVEGSKETARKLAAFSPDVVIGAAGDCVGSATWLVTDLLNVERLGIPTVAMVTDPFSDVAATLPRSEGFTEACFVAVPAPLGMIPSSVIREKVDAAFPALMKTVTGWQPSAGNRPATSTLSVETFDFSGSIEEMNDLFMERGWSLGLPVLPPTREQVERLLGGTTKRAHQIIGRVPPRMGVLTVELLAVCAAMAGCRPEHMPILIAAFEAFLQPEANLRLALSGTGTSQLVVVVSGPIVDQVRLASGQGAAGKGHHTNGSIGYAINLVAYAVGGSRPPSMDRSTLGSPSDYVCWVLGENEKDTPDKWGRLRDDEGFEGWNSYVTVMACYPPIENMDHWSASADEHIRWWGHIVNPLQSMGGAAIPLTLRQRPVIVLGPEHAALIASSGWAKDDFRKAFWEATRTPLSAWPPAAVSDRLGDLIGPFDGDTRIPVALKPEQLLVVVSGGDGKQSHYFAPLPGSFPVNRPIGH